MKLSQLLYHLYDSTLYMDVDITGLALDSRKVKPGDLFFACQGTHLDGRLFIDEAIAHGAVAILKEGNTTEALIHHYHDIPILPVSNLPQFIGNIAAEFYNHPSQKLKVVGITGTNGKTSCSYFIAQVLKHLGKPCGIIGTLGAGLYGVIKEGSLTTPDAVTLQSLLSYFVKHRTPVVAMEASSHSIDQGRINGIDFEVGIFTNLTRDHLDYHETMEAYGQAKKKLFTRNTTKYKVINADDSFGQTLLESLPKNHCYSYSLNPFFPQNKNSVVAKNIQLNHSGMQAYVYTPWGEGELFAPLLGEFNLSNLLATLTSLCLLDIPFEQVLESFISIVPVLGRMQMMGGGDSAPLVVVDYAHTPDALGNVLKTLRTHCKGKLLCLFGCGGDRDKGKRPLMAQIVEQFADLIIVTDDNPRTEDPAVIMAEIMKGFSDIEKVKIQHNRSKAIQDIIQYAEIGDCVLIAGKGAENYQHIGNEKIPFSDIQKVMESLNARLA